MDEIDARIIEMLAKDSRISFVKVAKKLDLTEGAVRARVKKLVKDGVIERFTIDVKGATMAIVMVANAQGVPTTSVARAIKAMNIGKVYEISGNYDIICFIQADNIAHLNDIIEKIRLIKGVMDTSSSMVLK